MKPQFAITRRRFAALASSALASSALVSSAAAQTAPGASVDRATLVEAAKKEGKLVFYTSTPEALATRFLQTFSQRFPFLDVSEFYRATSGRVKARLDAELEAQHYSADVFSNADVQSFIDLKQRQHLANFRAADLAKYPAPLKDPGYWTMWAVSPIMMAYNPTTLTGDAVPASWIALTDPRFRGRIGFEDATSGTQFAQWYALRQVMGPNFWSRVAGNKPHLFTGVVPIGDALLRGELLLAGETYGYHYVDMARKNAPFAAIYPQEGVPLNTSCLGVLSHAPHPNAARLFVDWALSQEGQEAVVDVLGYYSALPGVHGPAVGPKFGELKLLLPDSYEKLFASRDDFAADWRRLAAGG